MTFRQVKGPICGSRCGGDYSNGRGGRLGYNEGHWVGMEARVMRRCGQLVRDKLGDTSGW